MLLKRSFSVPSMLIIHQGKFLFKINYRFYLISRIYILENTCNSEHTPKEMVLITENRNILQG